ncbi:DUF4241 domain-containing protein [Promicromonospora umidemergens]|uniref:DUF4241 domain-containing protein n=1 Tax=Promicromonospora umidemergens TaxID=629679 RepID=A0ABP8XMU5_9MICO
MLAAVLPAVSDAARARFGWSNAGAPGQNPSHPVFPEIPDSPGGEPCAAERRPVPTGLAATYALGWDDGLVGTLNPAQARDRDTAGLPYVAVLHTKGDARGVIRVAWDERRAEVDVLDDAGHVTSRDAFRVDDESLFLLPHTDGEPITGTTSEEHMVRTVAYGRDGRAACVLDYGGSFQTPDDISRPRADRPDFGSWHDVLAIAGIKGADLSGTVGTPTLPNNDDGVPWAPGHPLRPGDLEAMFTPGARARESGDPVEIELVDAGKLRLPSVRLLATDPDYLTQELPAWEGALTARVAPGTYPVELSIAQNLANDWETVAGARIVVSDEPVESWELGLRKDQHEIDLDDGEFYGVSVDTGTASFTDVEAIPAVAEPAREVSAALEGWHGTVDDGGLVMWHAGYGDGSYPVRVGRDRDGAVTAFVADMLILD